MKWFFLLQAQDLVPYYSNNVLKNFNQSDHMGCKIMTGRKSFFARVPELLSMLINWTGTRALHCFEKPFTVNYNEFINVCIYTQKNYSSKINMDIYKSILKHTFIVHVVKSEIYMTNLFDFYIFQTTFKVIWANS